MTSKTSIASSVSKTSMMQVKCPIAMKYTIPASLLRKHRDDAVILQSPKKPASTIPGVQYSIKVYPNGNGDDRKGKAWVFLSVEHATWENLEVHCKFSLAVPSADFSSNCDHKFTRSQGQGIWFTHEELFAPDSLYLADEKLVVELKGMLWIEKEAPRPSSTNTRGLGNRLWEAKDKDFVISVGRTKGKKDIALHSWILTMRSPVFRAMLESGMKEAKDRKVAITDFTFDVVQAAVEFCYDRDISYKITPEIGVPLLFFGDKYDFQDLRTYVESILVEQVNVANVCQLENAAVQTNSTALVKACGNLLVNCLKTSTPVCDFETLDPTFWHTVCVKAFVPEFVHQS